MLPTLAIGCLCTKESMHKGSSLFSFVLEDVLAIHRCALNVTFVSAFLLLSSDTMKLIHNSLKVKHTGVGR